MVMVQVGGAATPGLAGQLMLAVGFGSNPVRFVLHRARSKAASGSGAHAAPKNTLSGTVATSVMACVASAASLLEVMTPAFNVRSKGRAVLAQYCRLECIAEARLAASMAASERRRAVVVVDTDSASILAIPNMPTQITMTATMTSTRLKPCEWAPAAARFISRSPGSLRASGC